MVRCVKIVTWNVNSIRTRLDQVLDWCEEHQPDVMCLQETKVPDQEFPEDEFGDIGYDVLYWGQPAYNGVAIATLEEASDQLVGFDGEPKDDDEPRIVSLEVSGVRIVDVYVPNGQELNSEKYEYKLEWLKKLRTLLESGPDLTSSDLVLCGDFNIAPGDLDVYNTKKISGLFVSEKERAAFSSLLELGLFDAFREREPDTQQFTWWDYRALGFPRNEGLRIDHFLVSKPVLDRTQRVWVDVSMRAGESPSDHAPVVLELG